MLCVMVVLFVAMTTAAPIINIYANEQENGGQQTGHTCDPTTTDAVVFSVGRSTLFSPTTLSVIPMDHVFYNDGGYFDESTNRFTAPFNGLYSFYFGANNRSGGKKVHLYLYAGNPEVKVASSYNYNKVSGHAGGRVILNLKAGEHVSIWLHGDNSRSFSIYKQTPPSTFFNGHLLQKLP